MRSKLKSNISYEEFINSTFGEDWEDNETELFTYMKSRYFDTSEDLSGGYGKYIYIESKDIKNNNLECILSYNNEDFEKIFDIKNLKRVK